MVLIAVSITWSSALRMLWYLGSLFYIWMLLLGLHIRELAVLPSICPSWFLVGGINDPSVCM